ncbi:MAG: alpha/beta fold hydrolase [Acidimicrobiales bacterium]
MNHPEARPSMQAPNPLLMALEARAALEGALGLAATPILRRIPKGDGHPIVVLPPFGAADHFTGGLRSFLANRGYDVHPWGHPEVLGLHRLVHVAAERVHEVSTNSGRAVTLIGHSLGGVYAREVARFIPDDVRSVITLGSPISDLKANHVWPMFEAASGTRVASLPDDFAERMAEAPPVPTTSIFSKTDGVVAWRSCIDHSEGHVENVEVVGSHIGLPSNPWAIYVVGDRLAHAPGSWLPFHRPGVRRATYPPLPPKLRPTENRGPDNGGTG